MDYEYQRFRRGMETDMDLTLQNTGATQITEVSDDEMFPFPKTILTTPIPEGIIQNLSPPLETLVSLEGANLSTEDLPTHLKTVDMERNFSYMRSLLPRMKVGYSHCHKDFSAVHTLPFNAEPSINDYYDKGKTRELLASSSIVATMLASCDGNPPKFDDECCDELQYPLAKGEGWEDSCPANNHTASFVHSLNMTERTSTGTALIHAYEVSPERDLNAGFIGNYAKVLNDKTIDFKLLKEFFDLQIFITIPHGSLQRGMEQDRNHYKFQFPTPYSRETKRNQEHFFSRLGPPLPNARYL